MEHVQVLSATIIGIGAATYRAPVRDDPFFMKNVSAQLTFAKGRTTDRNCRITCRALFLGEGDSRMKICLFHENPHGPFEIVAQSDDREFRHSDVSIQGAPLTRELHYRLVVAAAAPSECRGKLFLKFFSDQAFVAKIL